MREFIFCRYCPPIVFYPQIWMTKMNSKIEGNTLGILRRSFFPFNALGMPSFNNSVGRVADKCYCLQILFRLTFENQFKDMENSTSHRNVVLCYQNCSDLLWEKIVLVIEKNFWNSRLKAENFKFFWDH